jgi:hypothetical protein
MIFFALAVLFFSALAIAGETEKLIRREVPFGSTLNLKEFGGPNISVAITAAEISYVGATISDYTQIVPVARTNIQGVTVDDYRGTASVYGTNQVVMMPTRDSRRIEKKNGVRLPGTSSEMYLLYDDRTSGIRVYFLDTISPQNHHSFVVAIPPPPPPLPTPPTTSDNAEPTRQPGDGVISSELLAWYLKLQSARLSLDAKDSTAVAQFNRQAAEYHDALKRARVAKNPK